MSTTDRRARVPSVHALLARAEVAAWISAHGRASVVEALRRASESSRAHVADASWTVEDLLRDAHAELDRRARGSLVAVLNATGVLLHTNLGRAPLATAAIEAVAIAGAGACSLEIDLNSGGRGDRHAHAVPRLRRLVGAADALVVNNAAAALILALASVARETGDADPVHVVVSRGELVEIGGAFRIPEIIAAGGAHLVEVGTTNRTRIADYASALDRLAIDDPDAPVALLKVHRSNFAIVGFTEEASLADLVALAKSRKNQPPVIYDQGSGLLSDGARYGLDDEPDVARAIEAGVDLVVFSGDKLLGGPQAGLVVGSAEAVGRARRHPLCRALRCGKTVLAALDATLAIHERGRAHVEIPALRALAEELAAVRARADRVAVGLGVGEVVASIARVGAGAQPTREIASFAVTIAARGSIDSVDALAKRLRTGNPAVLARIEGDRLWLDVRAIADADVDRLIAATRAALATEVAT